MNKEYSLIIEHSARKSLKKLQPKLVVQIVFKIFSLQDNPFPQDYKKLKGYMKRLNSVKNLNNLLNYGKIGQLFEFLGARLAPLQNW